MLQPRVVHPRQIELAKMMAASPRIRRRSQADAVLPGEQLTGYSCPG